MEPSLFHDARLALHAGDCLEVLARLPECSVDAVVTDPPYHLASIVKRFGKKDSAPASSEGATGVYKRSSKGFMGKSWAGGEIAHDPATWAAVMRVLKPGGHCVAFHASKNWAYQAVAMTEAGFEMRDTIADLFDPSASARAFIETLSPAQSEMLAHLWQISDPLADLFWIYATGFPKGLDLAKGIDSALLGGAAKRQGASFGTEYERTNKGQPITPEAQAWDGWNVALKPAFEPICLGRKPLAEKRIVAQVLATGTGAINVGGCRIGEHGGTVKSGGGEKCLTTSVGGYLDAAAGVAVPGLGRWPANVTHDSSATVEAGFADRAGSEDANAQRLAAQSPALSATQNSSRFFFSAKANADDRMGSKHPTVKPIDLMRWLVRLVTPPGGVILDPFAGTGTTGEAALLEGFSAILIEREAEYRADIARRMDHVFEGASARAKAKAERAAPAAAMPLFDQPADGGGQTHLRGVCGSGRTASAQRNHRDGREAA